VTSSAEPLLLNQPHASADGLMWAGAVIFRLAEHGAIERMKSSAMGVS
jgi:hypothetical protein